MARDLKTKKKDLVCKCGKLCGYKCKCTVLKCVKCLKDEYYKSRKGNFKLNRFA